MFPCAWFGYGFGFWWIFPIIMIAMMVFCFFMMRRHGMGCWTSCCTRGKDRPSDGSKPDNEIVSHEIGRFERAKSI
jgi:uncharacterized membrane protein